MVNTLTDIGVATSGWCAHLLTDDSRNCIVAKAAPGAGLSLYVRSLRIYNGDNINVTVGEADAADTACESALFGPWNMFGRCVVNLDFNPPAKLTANKALCVDGSVAGNVGVLAQGYTDRG